MKLFKIEIFTILVFGIFLLSILDARPVYADFVFGEPTNLGPEINTAMHEYYPSISGDSLSLYIERAQADWSGVPEACLATRATQNDPWQEIVSFGPWADSKESFVPAIEKALNEAMGFEPGHTTADGLELYTWDDMLGGYGGMDLFVMKRQTTDNEWGPPENLGSSINSSSSDNSSFISPDGLTLHFVSMRPGGFGRTDMWVATRKTRLEPWETPVNLGPAVNSSSTDYNIGISTDSLLLFFASNRPGGYGDVDLWMTRRASLSDPWEDAVNLGSMPNTSDDDDSPCVSADGSTLYFSSNRSGGYGGYDIWQASIDPVVDLNGDGIVDAEDICIIVDYWGTDEPLCDIGPMPWGDGIVDVEDLIVLAEHLFEEFPPAEPVE